MVEKEFTIPFSNSFWYADSSATYEYNTFMFNVI